MFSGIGCPATAARAPNDLKAIRDMIREAAHALRRNSAERGWVPRERNVSSPLRSALLVLSAAATLQAPRITKYGQNRFAQIVLYKLDTRVLASFCSPSETAVASELSGLSYLDRLPHSSSASLRGMIQQLSLSLGSAASFLLSARRIRNHI
jgi:hypothetical protein